MKQVLNGTEIDEHQSVHIIGQWYHSKFAKVHVNVEVCMIKRIISNHKV